MRYISGASGLLAYKPNNNVSLEEATSLFYLEYRCASCIKFFRYFIIRRNQKESYFQKIGQFPSWDISIEKELMKFLGNYSKLYKNALICESQSYGIGAFAYYRRIVEGIIDNLLDKIPDLLDGEEKEKYMKALEETKKTKVTEKKIELVQDLLPPILKPDGFNSLKTLHSLYSEGLHGKSDEECLENAEDLRDVLGFVIKIVFQYSNERKVLTEKMKKLLEKKI